METQRVYKTFSSLGLQRVIELLSNLRKITLWRLVILWQWISSRLTYKWLGETMPGSSSLPILGSCLGIEEFSSKGIFNYAMKIFRKFKENSPTIHGDVRPYLVKFSNYSNDTEKVLTTDKSLEKGQIYKFLSPWLETRLFTSKGGKWKSRRKMLIPTFHFCIMEHFIPVFNSCSDELVHQLRKRVGSEAFDVRNAMVLLTMDVICETAMGVKINAQANSKTAYVTALNEILRLTKERVINPWLYFDFVYFLTDSGRKYRKCLHVVHDTIDKVIRERRKEFEKITEDTGSLNYEQIGLRRRVSFIDLLLLTARDGSLSDQDIREEVDTFMFTGQDTTHGVLSFTIFLLSRHQHVQHKVMEEIKGLFHSSQPLHITTQRLSELRYLDMVIKESMRLYPLVLEILRSTNEEYIPSSISNGLSGGSFKIESPNAGLHNPRLLPETVKFDPERFSAEKSTGLHPYEYLPFSAGPRNCIGQRFAMLEMKCALAKIVWNFRIQPEPGLESGIQWKESLKSLNSVLLQLKERHPIGH